MVGRSWPGAGAGGSHRRRDRFSDLLAGSGIPLVPAFATAAVLSPTDAVALSGIVGEGRIPKKIMGILQGEALMNDASGLVSLKFAVSVAMGTMVFTIGGATVEF